jgi:hypothetical protein
MSAPEQSNTPNVPSNAPSDAPVYRLRPKKIRRNLLKEIIHPDLTQDLADNLCQAAASGLTMEVAARLNGIFPDQLDRWLRMGENPIDRSWLGIEQLKFYVEFARKYRQGEAEHYARHIVNITKCALGGTPVKRKSIRVLENGREVHVEEETTLQPPNPVPSMWLLERGLPNNYGRKVAESQSGDNISNSNTNSPNMPAFVIKIEGENGLKQIETPSIRGKPYKPAAPTGSSIEDLVNSTKGAETNNLDNDESAGKVVGKVVTEYPIIYDAQSSSIPIPPDPPGTQPPSAPLVPYILPAGEGVNGGNRDNGHGSNGNGNNGYTNSNGNGNGNGSSNGNGNSNKGRYPSK